MQKDANNAHFSIFYQASNCERENGMELEAM